MYFRRDRGRERETDKEKGRGVGDEKHTGKQNQTLIKPHMKLILTMNFSNTGINKFLFIDSLN